MKFESNEHALEIPLLLRWTQPDDVNWSLNEAPDIVIALETAPAAPAADKTPKMHASFVMVFIMPPVPRFVVVDP
jgi:hypothetical protein